MMGSTIMAGVSLYTFVLLDFLLCSSQVVKAMGASTAGIGNPKSFVLESEEEESSVQLRRPERVTNLPGQPKVSFGHHAGYVTVKEENGRALFYWFFEAASDRNEKPLLMWLSGGPGCSSVGYGATQEIGPFRVDVNGSGLVLNKHSWNQEANLLFVESPIGVGFSYSNTSSDYNNIGDRSTADDTYRFIQNWFEKFPRYRKQDFYIVGESYAGKYVPELSELIYNRNKIYNKYHHVNLKGFMVGNAVMDDENDWKGIVDYAWSHAIITDHTHNLIKSNCNFSSNSTWANQNCTDAVNEMLKQYHQIDMYSLYTSACTPQSAQPAHNTPSNTHASVYGNLDMMQRGLSTGYDPCGNNYALVYYNRDDVQKALHAQTDPGQLKNWSICNNDILTKWTDSRSSVLPIYRELIAAGLRIWIYSGDTDGRVPVLSTRYSLNALKLPTIGSWRPWYHQGQVSGWTQKYEGLTFATFRGAGHAVPIFKLGNALVLLKSFLAGHSLPDER